MTASENRARSQENTVKAITAVRKRGRVTLKRSILLVPLQMLYRLVN